jgi:hypothetical protein
MLERVSMRGWTLASLTIGFLVALCIAIAPKPTCTRAHNEAPALVERTREPTTREQSLDELVAYAENAIHGCENPSVAAYEGLLAARALDGDGRYRKRIDVQLARWGPQAVYMYARRDETAAWQALRISREVGAREDVVLDAERYLVTPPPY